MKSGGMLVYTHLQLHSKELKNSSSVDKSIVTWILSWVKEIPENHSYKRKSQEKCLCLVNRKFNVWSSFFFFLSFFFNLIHTRKNILLLWVNLRSCKINFCIYFLNLKSIVSIAKHRTFPGCSGMIHLYGNLARLLANDYLYGRMLGNILFVFCFPVLTPIEISQGNVKTM